MAKTITRNIFVLLVLGFTLSVTDLSAQSRSGKADSHQLVAAPKNREKQGHTKKLEYFNPQLRRRL